MARDQDFKIAGTLSLTPKFRERQSRAREEKIAGTNTSENEQKETPSKKGKDLFSSDLDLIEHQQLCSFDSADTFIRLANRSEINSS